MAKKNIIKLSAISDVSTKSAALLPTPMLTSAPPLNLWTPLLRWTVWMAHMPVSSVLTGSPSERPGLLSQSHYDIHHNY
jgi:hypothetical protein